MGDGTRAHPRVVVLGALVADLTIWASRRPEPGETLLARRFQEFLGGKGFNQAIAARRLGADVCLVGAVGDDAYGHRFREALARDGIDGSSVVTLAGGTGIGQPLVTDDGEVSILGVPRANAGLDPSVVHAAKASIEAADALVLQCEVPIGTSLEAARAATGAGVNVILNPAPVVADAAELVALATTVICNELEARMLLGAADGAEPEHLVQGLADATGGLGVLTLGARGALACTDGRVTTAPAFAVDEVVDPTGAGDAFCGALTVALAEGHDVADALRFACAAGAVAVTIAGAAPSMPLRDDVDRVAAAI